MDELMSLKNTAKCWGYQQITTVSSAVGLTLPPSNTPDGRAPTFAIIQAATQAVRWRDDGTDPTATVGMTIPAGGEIRYDGNLNAIRFIEAAASAQLNISYYS